MNIVEKNERVTMVRQNLCGLPDYPLPPRYSIRAYSPGDEGTWVRIESAAEQYKEITLELFHGEFADDPAALAQRQFFLFDPQGIAIGTATAWFDSNYHGREFGRIHWVAIVPDSQGLGLARPLLSKICSTLLALGHKSAYLVTSTARVSAIRLYLLFGFLPEIRGPEDEAIWAGMESYVPGLKEVLRSTV